MNASRRPVASRLSLSMGGEPDVAFRAFREKRSPLRQMKAGWAIVEKDLVDAP